MYQFESLLAKANGDLANEKAYDTAADQFEKKAENLWGAIVPVIDSITKSTKAATAETNNASDATAGFARKQQQLNNELANNKKMAPLYQEWFTKIKEMNPVMDEFTRKQIEFNQWISKLQTDHGPLPILAQLKQLGQAFLDLEKTKAFSDLMLEGLYGVKKEVADLDKWYEEQSRKFIETDEATQKRRAELDEQYTTKRLAVTAKNADQEIANIEKWYSQQVSYVDDIEKRKTELAELYAKKRMELTAKYGKEDLEEQKTNLEKWKECWTQQYDFAKQKIDELTQKSKALGDTLQGMNDFLAKLNDQKKNKNL